MRNKQVLLQKNIWQEHDYDRFIQSLIEHEFEIKEVHVIPFTTDFDPVLPEYYDPDYVFGSGRFVNICRESGYRTFPSFSPDQYHFQWDDYVNEGEAHKWGSLIIDEPVFVKPFTEKFFTGRVIESQEDKEKVQLATSFIDNPDDELVMVSNPVKIDMEVRFFVIGGTIISGSTYRVKGVAQHSRVADFHPAQIALKRIIKDCYVAEGFVIDMGLVNGEWKIVELNNLNSSGIYHCDTDAIANALKHL